MKALMQDWSMTLDKILDHAARWHGDREVITRSVEGPIVRSAYAEFADLLTSRRDDELLEAT